MKNRKIFDIEKIGFGDELGGPVTANRLPKPVAEKPVATRPIIAKPTPVNKVQPRSLAPKLEIPKVEEPVKKQPSRFKAVEFISPISGSRRKKPEKLHLAHGQYLVEKQELERPSSKTEDFTTLTEDWNLETAHQSFIQEKKPTEKKIFDVEAELAPITKTKPAAPVQEDRNFFASVAENAIVVKEEKGYYESPPLKLLDAKSRLRAILSAPATMLDNDPLLIALGMDTQGSFIYGKLGALKHHAACTSDPLLLHSLVLSLLFKGAPSDLRLIMADSLRRNLSIYEGLPHLALPILQGLAQIKVGLGWLESECARRYEVFAKVGVDHIDAFNERRPSLTEELTRLPYLVVVIDELAEVSSELLGLIMRQGPQAGIHVLAATAFEKASQFESRLVDGEWHYEGVQPLELPSVSLSEIGNVVAHIKSQATLEYLGELDLALEPENLEQEQPEVTEILEQEQPELTEALASAEPAVSELVAAIGLFLERGEASISLLQIQLGFSYRKSVRVMDALLQRGWITKVAESAKREINLTQEEFLEITAS